MIEINFLSKVYSTGCMTSLVIRYNVYILKDPKNFVNVDNCTIVQLQTKDQLMSTIGISFCNYQVAGEDPDCTIVQLKTKDRMVSIKGFSLMLCFHDITCWGKP